MYPKLKLLHIISDEKFPDGAYRQFETVAPGASTYLLPGKKKPIKYLKKIDPVRVSRFSYLNRNFIDSLNEYDAIILHAMTNFALELIGRAAPNVKFVWIGMGYDYYDLIYPDAWKMLGPITSRLVKECMPDYGRATHKNLLKAVLKQVIYPHAKKKRELIKRISIFSPVLRSEYEVVQNAVKGLTAEYAPWNYGLLTNLVDSLPKKEWSTGRNILVGNSANPTNNHLEVFRQLKKLKLCSRTKIIVPLSYGNLNYRDYILNEGVKAFGDNFLPITEYLDFNEYVDLLSSCSIVIMNHKRQQGAGNVGIALALGAKIFLNPKSLLFKEYKDQGVNIFSITEMYRELVCGVVGLDAGLAARNREFLMREKSANSHIERTQSLLATIKHGSYG